MRYLLQKSEITPLMWVLTDTEMGIVMTFIEGKFNDSQKVTTLHDIKRVDANELAAAMCKMADWLHDRHYEIMFSSPQQIKLAARKKIGEALRDAREAKGYSLRYLSKLTGISFDNISRIENGRYAATVDTLAVLAGALGVTLKLT